MNARFYLIVNLLNKTSRVIISDNLDALSASMQTVTRGYSYEIYDLSEVVVKTFAPDLENGNIPGELVRKNCHISP